MKLRSPGLVAALLSILIVGSGFDDSLRAEDGHPEFSSVSEARARFLTRIREMLSESAKMEAAGRPQDAMLVAVRARRMLDALGGESAWPRGETSPAQVVALLADRHGPGSLAQTGSDRRTPKGQVRRTAAGIRPEKREPSNAVVTSQKNPSPAERPTLSNRFPDVPAASRSWVPVGTPKRKSGDWTPIGPAPMDARPVQQTGAEQLIQIPALSEVGTEEGRNATDSDSAKISDLQVEPIPVHLSPEIRPAAGIDIHASEEPQEFRPYAQPIPMTDLLPNPSPESPSETTSDEISASSSDASISQLHSEDSSSNVSQPAALDAEAGSSRVLFATLAGAAAGVLLVLIGGFLVRRFNRTATVAAVNHAEETTSTVSEAQVNASQNHTVSLPGVAWQPGSSWVGSPPSPPLAVPVLTPPESSSQSPQPATPPQLQIFHEASENDPDVKPENADVADSEVDPAADANSAPPATPAVPFRVIGTTVVLGEAASAKVDEELQHRRQRIMQAVFEENVATQSSLNNTHGDEAA